MVAADILKRALTLLYQALPAEGHIVLVVHDEIVLDIRMNHPPVPVYSSEQTAFVDALLVECSKAKLPLHSTSNAQAEVGG